MPWFSGGLELLNLALISLWAAPDPPRVSSSLVCTSSTQPSLFHLYQPLFVEWQTTAVWVLSGREQRSQLALVQVTLYNSARM